MECYSHHISIQLWLKQWLYIMADSNVSLYQISNAWCLFWVVIKGCFFSPQAQKCYSLLGTLQGCMHFLVMRWLRKHILMFKPQHCFFSMSRNKKTSHRFWSMLLFLFLFLYLNAPVIDSYMASHGEGLRFATPKPSSACRGISSHWHVPGDIRLGWWEVMVWKCVQGERAGGVRVTAVTE